MTSIVSGIANAASAAVDGAAADAARLKGVAKSFEAVFVRQMIGAMRQTGIGDDLTGSSAVDQFQEMSDAKTADNIAEHGGLGIAQMLLRQLGPQDADKAKAIATDPAKASETYAAARNSAA